MSDLPPYNPLDLDNLGVSVMTAMLAQPVIQMSALRAFDGAGIYAIYYTGSFPSYVPLAQRNLGGRFEQPIYVGKAIPAGGRKGGRRRGEVGAPLFHRLRQHQKSLQDATNLDVADFWCRYLVVEDIWIPLGESLLIERFQPLWNVVVEGFGNHDPGKGRHRGECPHWDTIHPGRPWASQLQPNRRSAAEILENARRALVGQPAELLPEDRQLDEANSDEG
jgi:hypothetical protein